MSELDTLRGIAVLGVLFLHGFEWQYGGLRFGRAARLFIAATQPGSLGVDLFFVLSGFLITGILVESRESPDYYARFYPRRALRILPVYYALLIVLLLLHSSSIRFVGLSFIYLANMTNIFGVSCDYGPLWSLAVEEHYYLLWPAVVRRASKRGLLLFSLTIMAAVPLLRLVCFWIGWGKGSLDWYTWFVADGLATGSFVAVAVRIWNSREFARKLCQWLLGGATAIGLAGYHWGIATRQRALGAALQQTTVSLFFAGTLLLFLLLGTSQYKRYVNSSILRFFGYISYGLYLDHLLAFRMYDRIALAYWPSLIPASYQFGLVLLKFVIAGGAAVGAAFLSRRYFEEQFLRFKDRIPWTRVLHSNAPNSTQEQPQLVAAS